MRLFTIICLAAVLACAIAPSAKADSLTFDNITNWVGTGANRAGLLVDWNDGKGLSWQAWGYRWEGAAPTLTDMIKQITGSWRDVDWVVSSIELGSGSGATADLATVFRVHGSYGHAVDSFAFDLDGDDALLDGTDADDHFKAGFEKDATGYWSSYNRTENSSTWSYAMLGMDDTDLADGYWYGFSWAEGFVDSTPTPEPATMALLGIGGAAGLVWRRRRSR